MKDRLFIYHGSCFDGFTAAYLWWHHSPNGGSWTYHGAVHGERPPLDGDFSGKEVMIVDFSYPSRQLCKMAKTADRLTILDHHKTAVDRLAAVEALEIDSVHTEFDNDRCGAVMLWDYMVRQGWIDDAVPILLRYIQDRDLWTMELPDVRKVSAYVSAQAMTFYSWRRMFSLSWRSMDAIFSGGEAILQYIEQYGMKALEQAHLEQIAGFEVPVVNLPYMNCSEHITALLDDYPNHPFAAGYFQRADGRWQFSLRSRGDFDVSEIAKKMGGGGHRGAAGFDVPSLHWE